MNNYHQDSDTDCYYEDDDSVELSDMSDFPDSDTEIDL